MLHVIIKEDLHDKAFVEKWTYGFDRLAEAVEEWTPEKTSEITWVPVETIQKVARMYATLKPAAMHESNGIDQHPSVFQTTRAMDCLVAITGNLNRRGAVVLDPWSKAAGFQPWRDMTLRNPSKDAKQTMWKKSVSNYPFYYGMFYGGISHIMDALATGKPYPIKALIAQGINPMVTNDHHSKVEKALRRVPFLAVLDTRMTPTGRIADLVLPAATYLEKDSLLKWAFRAKPRADCAFLGLQRKVVEPQGEAKSEFDFFRDLMWAVGHRDKWPFRTMQEWVDYELEPMGLSFEKLAADPGKIIWKTFTDEELGEKGLEKFLQLPFFPQNKIPLYSDFLENVGIDPLPHFKELAESPFTDSDLAKEYPLVAMASIKPGVFVHAQYRNLTWLNEILPEPFVEIHPETAAELGIQEGKIVTVESLRGSIELKARLIRTMDRRAVALTHGWWEPVTNVITPSEFRDPVCGATSNHCFQVRISKRRK
jgi:anaerobic selenocysteine-containing dehydrogenase